MSSCMQILQILYVLFLCYHLSTTSLVPCSSTVFTVFSVTQFTEDNGGADTGSGVTPGHRLQHLAPCVYHCALWSVPTWYWDALYPQNIHWQEGPSAVKNLFKHQFVIVSWQNRKLIVDAFYKEEAYSDYTLYIHHNIANRPLLPPLDCWHLGPRSRDPATIFMSCAGLRPRLCW